MIDEDHLDEDDDPTIGVRSGKAKASRESDGFVPWSDEDMALYRAKWPLGTDVLHYTFLRLGDAHRFGPPHLRQIVSKKMPTHYIAQAHREKLGISGTEKIVAFDQSQSIDDFLQPREAHSERTSDGNGVVTFPGNIRKKA
jgi:hypothetical protein